MTPPLLALSRSKNKPRGPTRLNSGKTSNQLAGAGLPTIMP